MPKPYRKKFRDDVVRVASQREDGVTLKQVAKDFGISESCLTKWIAIAPSPPLAGTSHDRYPEVTLSGLNEQLRAAYGETG